VRKRLCPSVKAVLQLLGAAPRWGKAPKTQNLYSLRGRCGVPTRAARGECWSTAPHRAAKPLRAGRSKRRRHLLSWARNICPLSSNRDKRRFPRQFLRSISGIFLEPDYAFSEIIASARNGALMNQPYLFGALPLWLLIEFVVVRFFASSLTAPSASYVRIHRNPASSRSPWCWRSD